MEMRATGDVAIAVDVTPWVPPLAHCLHRHTLSSHCSACFLALSSAATGGCSACPLRYCSSACSAADAASHLSSGECRLLSSLLPPDSDLDATDLRLALRLLFSLQSSLPSSGECPDRIGGLLTNLDKMGSSDGRTEEVKLLSLARELRGGGGDGWMEEAALCAALTNAVEVMAGEDGQAIGAAVYPPGFSWFNHSCSPNACYRFELAGSRQNCGRPDFLAAPDGEDEVEIKNWGGDEMNLTNGLWYGPRVVARCIRPIRKGEEVCITYIDPLLPKEKRQSELLSSYLFDCCCYRCHVSPPTYVDRVLQENPFQLSDRSSAGDVSWIKLIGFVELTINKYIMDGHTEECCENLEALLLQFFNYAPFSRTTYQKSCSNGEARVQPTRFRSNSRMITPISHREAELLNQPLKVQDCFDSSGMPATDKLGSNTGATLHPIHHNLLNAYVTLASAYKVSCSGKLDIGNRLEAFKLSKAGAAYSLLLAGGMHHLFVLEPSLVASAAQMWVSAGNSLLELYGGLTWGFHNKKTGNAYSCNHKWRSPIVEIEFKETCDGLHNCIKDSSTVVWPFLICEIPCLKFIKSPVEFSWLERLEVSTSIRDEDDHDMRSYVYELSAHCLILGGYLAAVCYGPECKLVDNVRVLLSGCPLETDVCVH